MNNKGFTIIVAWIFIMIAGALIIALFFAIAINLEQLHNDQLSADALQKLDSILATQQSSTNTYTKVPIANERIRMVCTQVGEGILSQIDIGGFSRTTEYDLVVGRDLETDELLLFSQELRLPFRLGNILFVGSNQETLTILESGNQEIDIARQALIASFPHNTKGEAIIPMDITGNPRTLDNVRIVQLTSVDRRDPPPPQIPGFDGSKHKDALYIEVKGTRDGILTQGAVYYYKGTGTKLDPAGGPFFYVGTPMLMAYIWMGDSTRAECLSEKIHSILETQSKLQKARFNILKEVYGEHHTCGGLLGTLPASPLSKLHERENPLFKNLNNKVQAVETRNDNLLRGVRCATIY